MRRIILSHGFIFFTLLFSMLSCSSELNTPDELNEDINSKVESQNNGTNTSNSSQRRVTYKLAGDFSGKLDITFLSSDGFTPPDQIIGVKIPWDTFYEVPNNIQAIGGFANGLYGDAKPGETASLKMFLNDYLIETVIRTSDKDGMITLPLESYDLEFDKSGTTISDENIGKDIAYTVKGSFSGNLELIYKVVDGSYENIIVTELPWHHTFKTTKDSYEARIYGMGSSGIEGEDLEFSLTVEQTVFKAESVITNKEGQIGLFPEIVLEFE